VTDVERAGKRDLLQRGGEGKWVTRLKQRIGELPALNNNMRVGAIMHKEEGAKVSQDHWERKKYNGT